MFRSIDCVGDMCPVPIVKAKIKYKKLNANESITIVSDHSCTAQGVKDAFHKFNCSIKTKEQDGIWHITITKF